jgi:hypothetical protein
METQAIEPKVNLQIVESILQLIRSLPIAERQALEQRLSEELAEYPEVTTPELMMLAEKGGSFDFLHNEPDLYAVEDGEPIQWTISPAPKRSVLEILAEWQTGAAASVNSFKFLNPQGSADYQPDRQFSLY